MVPCVRRFGAHGLQRVDQIRAEFITVLSDDRSHLFFVLRDAFRLAVQVLDHLLDRDIFSAVERIPQAQTLVECVFDRVVIFFIRLPGSLQRGSLGLRCHLDLLVDKFHRLVADIAKQAFYFICVIFRESCCALYRLSEQVRDSCLFFQGCCIFFCGFRRLRLRLRGELIQVDEVAVKLDPFLQGLVFILLGLGRFLRSIIIFRQ